MEKYVIHGGNKLNGTINISGAKNAALAIIPAALFARENVALKTFLTSATSEH